VAHSYFHRLDETPAAGRYASGPATAGPWAANLQHGGPPSALAVAAAERVVQAETGRDDLVALRLSADFVGPVPVAELETRARVVRAARSAALAEVTVTAAGRDCLLVRVWFVRDADTSQVARALSDPVGVPEGRTGLGTAFGYGESLEWRFIRGAMGEPGPGTAWVRPRTALFDDDYVMSGLSRVVLIADSGSGISAELDWAVWSFLNVDLDVHLARPVIGEWVLMDATTQLGSHGSALARSTLSDVHGPVGSGLQTLVVAPHRR
jgi:acyl-coenzyme A thioesterase PaaI-like protein